MECLKRFPYSAFGKLGISVLIHMTIRGEIDNFNYYNYHNFFHLKKRTTSILNFFWLFDKELKRWRSDEARSGE